MKKLDKNWLEWSVFTVSTLLVVAVAALLVYQSATSSESPASLAGAAGLSERRGEWYYLQVRVRNSGGLAAEDVHIEVTLERGEEESERAEFQLPFIPAGAERTGWAAFRTDPDEAEKIIVRPMGYHEP